VNEIGSILREARELKGESITQAYEKLRISPKYLTALEEGRYERLPSPTHVRGYLGKYARHLGLDPEPLLERYEVVRQQHLAMPAPLQDDKSINMPPLPMLPPEPETGTFFTHANMEVGHNGGAKGDSPWVNRLIVVGLLVAIGLISWRFYFSTPDNPLAVENIGEAVRQELLAGDEAGTVTGSEDEAGLLLAEPGEVLTATQRITPTMRNNGSTAVVNDTIPTTTRPPLPSTMETIELQLDVTERTWMRVLVDGINVYEGQARRGDTFNWTAQESVELRSGNGAGLYAMINGVELGRLGERGQVINETWLTTR
jgi:cytoskeleton protein RodZ